MSNANELALLIPGILGLLKEPLNKDDKLGDRIFRAIDKHDTGAVDIQVFKRELMKLNSEVDMGTWRTFFALLGTGTDNKVHCQHFQRAIKKHLKLIQGVDFDARTEFTLSKRAPRTKANSVWVRGDVSLNRLSGTTLFDMAVVDGSSLRHIYRVFCEMDSESNGWISLREMKSYMRRHAENMLPIATSLFNRADHKRQGSVSFEQLMHALYPSCFKHEVRKMVAIARQDQDQRKTKIDASTMEDVIDIFKVYDDNGDNTLDVEEFCSAIKSLGWTDSEAQSVFHEIDQDKSGLISLEEFVKWFTNSKA